MPKIICRGCGQLEIAANLETRWVYSSEGWVGSVYLSHMFSPSSLCSVCLIMKNKADAEVKILQIWILGEQEAQETNDLERQLCWAEYTIHHPSLLHLAFALCRNPNLHGDVILRYANEATRRVQLDSFLRQSVALGLRGNPSVGLLLLENPALQEALRILGYKAV